MPPTFRRRHPTLLSQAHVEFVVDDFIGIPVISGIETVEVPPGAWVTLDANEADPVIKRWGGEVLETLE
jgi:hypothetical protein